MALVAMVAMVAMVAIRQVRTALRTPLLFGEVMGFWF
jgi:hypothetical protein